MTDPANSADQPPLSAKHPSGVYVHVKRLADVLAAGIGLVLVSPILLAAAAALKVTSRGPVFFTQMRAGLNDRPFRVLKFRTMRADRTADPAELVPLTHPDITRIGRLLRRTKIDELPQIINVLLGHMSIIGPRPTLPDQAERYDDFQRQRLWVRPGCSGLAQINGNIAISWPERIKWDVYYVHHMSPWLDLQILFRTPMVILLGDARFTRRLDDALSPHEAPTEG